MVAVRTVGPAAPPAPASWAGTIERPGFEGAHFVVSMDAPTDQAAPPTPPASGPLHALAARAPEPVRGVVESLVTISVGRYVTAVLGGAVLALVLAATLGRLRVDVAGSIGALSLVLVLLFIAVWDLLVRWGLLPRQPVLVGAPQQALGVRLLRPVTSWALLALGLVVGHLFWRG